MSKQNHCLFDLLLRQQAQEFIAEIPLIISNHPNLQGVAEQFGIDYHHIPITKENKQEQELQQLKLLKKYQIDLVVLAKYLQVVSADFITKFPQIVNIHHSFLPAFVGANPYHKAYEWQWNQPESIGLRYFRFLKLVALRSNWSMLIMSKLCQGARVMF